MVYDTYSDTVNNVALVAAGIGVYSLIKEVHDWGLGDILLSRNADVRAAPCRLYGLSDAMSRAEYYCSR